VNNLVIREGAEGRSGQLHQNPESPKIKKVIGTLSLCSSQFTENVSPRRD